MSESSKAVFLSYASQDAEAARRICEALRSGGVEVWFDADGGLEHGDEWDAKIRRQIKECVLFIPVISANTQARHEGYFRIEWELAAQRALGIASGVPFILPVVIDDTREPDALAPDRFRAVQWTRLHGGEVPPEVQQRFLKLWSHRTGVLKHEAQEVARAFQPVGADDTGWKAHATPKVGRRVPAAAWAAAIIAIGAAAGGYFWLKRPAESAPIPAQNAGAGTRPPTHEPTIAAKPPAGEEKLLAPRADAKSIVVLPFANLSGDPAQEYFSDGLTEEILNALARERDLRVVPRTSAFSFKGKNVPLPEIAQALNVAQIVEGSVQRIGNRVRIRCTFTRVADGFAVPLPPFDRELKDGADIFALEDEVARAVVEKLTQRTTTAAPVAVLTKNPDAYDAYLRGRDLMNQTSPSWPKAVEALRRAVELDPQFALAWANLGQLSASLYAYGFDGAALAASGRAIAEALRLQPDLPEAHLARAFYLRANNATPEAVESELAEAERMRPDAPEIVEFRASVEFARGIEESGIKLMQRAVDLDPRNGAKLNTLGNELTSAGRYAEAEATYRQAFQILGSSIPLTNRARIYFLWKGDRALATRTLDEAPAAIRGERYWTSRALLLYATGDQPGALAAAAHMKPRSEFFRIRALFTARMREAMGDAAGAQQDYLTALPLAEQQRDEFSALPEPYAVLGLVYAGLGRKAEALAAVRKAIEGDRPGAIAASTTGHPELARKGISALTSVDLEIDPLVALAQVQARVGMMDDALALVQAATTAGRLRRNYLLLSPDWAMLRKDPRCRAIAEKAPL